ncbi:MAG TPA: phage portal protein [Dehalococcoidia bacterium]|nr:phage portal protein [Dehalococcoidia bacterium]
MPPTPPLPQLLKNRDRDRLQQYTDALAFYEGKQWPAADPRTRSARRLTLNYVKTIINKTSTYVMQGAAINAIPQSDSEEHVAAAAAVEQYLAALATDNGLTRLDLVTEVDAAVLGDAAYKVTWDPAEERVAITAPDVRGLFPWPHPTDPTRYTRVAHRYTLPREDVIALWGIAPRDKTAEITEDWTDKTLDIWIDGGPAPMLSQVNPYGLIPFVIYPNAQVPKRWWGESDVLPLKEVAQEFNRQMTRVSNIMELSGFPIAVLENVDSTQDIAAQPGAVWELPEGAKAYLLDLLQGGGVRLHLDYTDHLLRALHDLSETPRTAFGGTDRDLSGVALQVEMQPLLQKVERKRIIRSDAYRLRAALSLKLSDLFAGTEFTDSIAGLTADWATITPPDQALDAGREVALVGAGIRSRQTALANLGDPDPETELARVIEEAKRLSALALQLQPPAAANVP